MVYRLGVDVGTTFTAAGVQSGTEAKLLMLSNLGPVIPSAVGITAAGDVIVGSDAIRLQEQAPDRVVQAFKRGLGDPSPIAIAGEERPSTFFMTEMLRTVLARAVAVQGSEPDSLAITHPAGWREHKVGRLRAAAVDAGIDDESLLLLTEPEAAALFHGLGTTAVEEGETILVYDLGGGSFDTAILRRTRTGHAVLGRPEGIDRLGGLDFDAAVLRYVTEQLGPVAARLDEPGQAALVAKAQLRRACVVAKEALSFEEAADVEVALGRERWTVRLERASLEALIRPALMESIGGVRRVLRSANIEPGDVSRIVLAGGSSRIPLVAELVSNEMGQPVVADEYPKRLVALGAALAAATAAPTRRDAGTGRTVDDQLFPPPRAAAGRTPPSIISAGADTASTNSGVVGADGGQPAAASDGPSNGAAAAVPAPSRIQPDPSQLPAPEHRINAPTPGNGQPAPGATPPADPSAGGPPVRPKDPTARRRPAGTRPPTTLTDLPAEPRPGDEPEPTGPVPVVPASAAPLASAEPSSAGLPSTDVFDPAKTSATPADRSPAADLTEPAPPTGSPATPRPPSTAAAPSGPPPPEPSVAPPPPAAIADDAPSPNPARDPDADPDADATVVPAPLGPVPDPDPVADATVVPAPPGGTPDPVLTFADRVSPTPAALAADTPTPEGRPATPSGPFDRAAPDTEPAIGRSRLVYVGLALLLLFAGIAAGVVLGGILNRDQPQEAGADPDAAQANAAWPATLRLAVPSSLDLDEDDWALVAILEDELELEVELLPTAGLTSVAADLGAGTADLGLLDPQNYAAATADGLAVRPIAVTAEQSDDPGYTQTLGITTADNGSVTDIEDFAPGVVCFVDRRSALGYRFPIFGLDAVGIDPDDPATGVTILIAGSHRSAVDFVVDGTCPIGFASSAVIAGMLGDGTLDGLVDSTGTMPDRNAGQAELKVVWRGPKILGPTLVMSSDLPTDLQERLIEVVTTEANHTRATANGHCASSTDCRVTSDEGWGYAPAVDADFDGYRFICGRQGVVCER